MSLTATRNPIPARFSAKSLLDEALFEDGFEWKHGHLTDLFSENVQPWQLAEVDFADIVRMDDEQFEAWESKKSWGATWMARRLRSKRQSAWGYNFQLWRFSVPQISLDELRSDLSAYRDISRYLRGLLKAQGLDITPGKLMHLGIRFAWQAERFVDLYAECAVPGRPWGSCYQPNHGKVLAIALCPNFRKLPTWVKAAMVKSTSFIHCEGRVGDIWRYIDCAKAWKHCPDLPKKIAERVGKMSVKARMLSAIAWRRSLRYENQKEAFWLELQELLSMSLGKILSVAIGDGIPNWGRCKYQRLINLYLGLPHDWDLNLDKEVNLDDCLRAITEHGDAEQVCLNVYGVAGKATIAAFSKSKNASARKWAMFLAKGNADLLQKYFALEECIEFESEAVEFLQQLGDRPALRMIATTIYKIRGEEKPVENYLIRDTGYLWNQIRSKPELGRIRCWLSAHEDLARKFVAEQPDEALPIHPQWLPIDGLCDVNGEWEIAFPKSTNDLKLWGQILSHCVGGYGNAVKSGRSIIFAVVIDGRVAYTVEMCPTSSKWHVNQFLGLRNCYAPERLSESVLGALRQAGLSL